MTATEKRKQVADFIKKEADEKLVDLVYTLVQDYMNNAEVVYELSDEQVKELEAARKQHKSGKGKTYSLEEVKNIITGKSKP